MVARLVSGKGIRAVDQLGRWREGGGAWTYIVGNNLGRYLATEEADLVRSSILVWDTRILEFCPSHCMASGIETEFWR